MINAYKIGVSIAMSSNAAAVLGVLQKDLFGLQKAADLTIGKFNAMKLAALGAMGAVGGFAVLEVMKKLVEHGSELVHQEALMQTAGMNRLQIQEALNKATESQGKILGTTISQNMQALRELRYVFVSTREANLGLDPTKIPAAQRERMAAESTQEAMANLDTVLKAQRVMSLSKDKLGAAGGIDQVYNMARALEEIGAATNPKRFDDILNAWVQATIASGGRVTGTAMLSAIKYARTARYGFSDEFLKHILPTLVQEFSSTTGGGGASGGPGNALMSAFRTVVSGVMSHKAIKEWSGLGLIDPTKIIWQKNKAAGLERGAVEGADEFAQNPYMWVQDVLLPALKKRGITAQADIIAEISHLFEVRTASDIISAMGTQQQRTTKDVVLQQQTQGLNAFDTLLKADPVARMQALSAAWTSFLEALGAPAVPFAIDVLTVLTTQLNRFTAWAIAHPELIGYIEKLVAVLGALAIAGGTIAILTAAIRPIATIITLLSRLGLGMTVFPLARMIGLTGALTALGTAFKGMPDIAAIAAAFGTLAKRLSIIGAIISALIPTNKTDTTQQEMDKLNKALGRGGAGQPPPVPTFKFNEKTLQDMTDDKALLKKQSWNPPPKHEVTLQPINVIVDGDVVQRSVVRRMDRDARRPPDSVGTPDNRLSPNYPALVAV